MKRLKTRKEAAVHPLEGRPEKSSSGLTSLGDILRKIMNDPSLPFSPEDARIWHVWDAAVGQAIAQNARPAWIRHGVLRVRVSGPIWLQELEYAREAIREKLNAALERPAVREIEFRLGDPSRD